MVAALRGTSSTLAVPSVEHKAVQRSRFAVYVLPQVTEERSMALAALFHPNATWPRRAALSVLFR